MAIISTRVTVVYRMSDGALASAEVCGHHYSQFTIPPNAEIVAAFADLKADGEIIATDELPLTERKGADYWRNVAIELGHRER